MILLEANVIEGSGDVNASFNLLRSENPIKKHFSWIINKLFIEDINKSSSVCKLLFKMILSKYNQSRNEIELVFKEFCRSKKIKSLMIPKLSNYKSADHFFEIIYEKDLIEDNKRFVTEILKYPVATHNEKPEEEEIVRLIHGLFKHKDSKTIHIDLLYDFSYAFFPFRSDSWIKNRKSFLNRYVRSEADFISLMTKVKNWRPRSKGYSFIENAFPDYEKNIYKQLVEIDYTLWNASGIFSRVKELDAAELFLSVTPVSVHLDANPINLRLWSSRNNITVIDQIIIQISSESEDIEHSISLSADNNAMEFLVDYNGDAYAVDENDNLYFDMSNDNNFEINHNEALNNNILVHRFSQSIHNSILDTPNETMVSIDDSNRMNTKLLETIENSKNQIEFCKLVNEKLCNLLDRIKKLNITFLSKNESGNESPLLTNNENNLIINDLDTIYMKLVKCFNSNKFTINISRKKQYNNKNRPSIEDWNSIINRLDEQKRIMKCQNNEYICLESLNMSINEMYLNKLEAKYKKIQEFNLHLIVLE